MSTCIVGKLVHVHVIENYHAPKDWLRFTKELATKL